VIGNALAKLGRHGSAFIGIGIFVGLFLPPLAALMKPLLLPAVVVPFLIALIRMDWGRLGQLARRPLDIALATLWLLVLAPLLVHGLLISLPALPPSIHGGLVLMAAAPPLMASASLALLLGLDVALAVLLTVVATALVPFTLPLIGLHLLDIELEVGVVELMARLGTVVGGCFLVAWVLRRLLPADFGQRHGEALNGVAVAGLLVFALAIMDGATAMLLARPGFVITCAIGVYALNIGLQGAGAALFGRRGWPTALTLGLCSGNTNLGLLLASMADRASAELFVFVAVAQLPIYTLPVIQRRLYRRWLAKEPRARQTGGDARG
jgi:BASS family bile acid:Na+ symporter